MAEQLLTVTLFKLHEEIDFEEHYLVWPLFVIATVIIQSLKVKHMFNFSSNYN